MSYYLASHTVALKRAPFRRQALPLQPLVDDKVHNAAILFDQAVREVPISSQVGRHAVELVDAIDACRPSDLPADMASIEYVMY